MDAETRAGYERGSLILGLSFAFFFVMLVDAAFASQRRHFGRGTALEPIGIAALVGGVIFIGLFMSVIWFNRPMFLVPPGLRSELGAIAGRRRRRREHLPMI